MIELVVQVNGKVRAKIQVAAGIGEEEAVATALGDPVVARFAVGAVRKVVFVPGRLINIVL
jgi:leucyl-tRNA synthetase